MVQIKELPQVGFKEAAINAFKKMFQFKGRIRRSEYWWGYLVLMICYFVVNLIPIIGQIAACFIMIACISMLFRRLHDTGRSGWWWGIAALLMIGIGFLIFGTVPLEEIMDAAQDNDPMPISKVIADGFSKNPTAGISVLILYLLVFIVGVATFIFTLLDSKPEANKYGPSPKYIEEV